MSARPWSSVASDVRSAIGLPRVSETMPRTLALPSICGSAAPVVNASVCSGVQTGSAARTPCRTPASDRIIVPDAITPIPTTQRAINPDGRRDGSRIDNSRPSR